VDIFLRIELTPERRLGPGKIALLEAIARTGSLSAAARELGMGYRTAWVLIDSLNAMFDEPVVKTLPDPAGNCSGF
jgi:molybdate transport system regulatory protein